MIWSIKYILSPEKLLAFVRKKKLEYSFKSYQLKIGLFSSVENSSFGRKVYVGEKCTIKNCSIGDHTYVNNGSTIRHAQIGKYCSIASNTIIGMGIHPTNLVSTHPAFYSNNKGFETFAELNHFNEDVQIIVGNDVWIGTDVKIIGNISIGDGAIVAAGAIVTKNVPPYAIYGGVPAKLIKYRFSPNTIQTLLEIQWWNYDENWLKQNYIKFLNVEYFIKEFST